MKPFGIGRGKKSRDEPTTTSTKIIQHRHIIISLKTLDSKLDSMALDGWTLLTSSPVNANMVELKSDAQILCVLTREIKI